MTEILTYHNISDNNQDKFATTPLFFESEMRWLAKQGYKGISLKEFYKDIKQEKVFVLTFDDGYKDFFDVAVPILNELNFSATIFIVSKLIGNISLWRKEELRSALLDWDEVHEIVKIGHEIGSHGLYHRDLLCLSKKESIQEIAGSKKLIEGNIKVLVVSFSYPWNRCNEQILRIVEESSYKYAIITGKKCRNNFETDRFQLYRQPITNSNSVKDFIK